MIAIEVNGAPRVFHGATVSDLLADIGVGTERPGIAVARNGELVRRTLWSSTAIAAGDRLEVVTARGGG